MKKVLLWIIAFLITFSAAFYQRMTGPTHPLRGKTTLNGTEIAYKLERDPETTSDHEVQVEVPNREITGNLLYKRYKTDDPWTKIPMKRDEDVLAGSLPKQPSAGKLEYKILLASQGSEISLTGEKSVIIRFKDPVPSLLLLPHIIIMFLAMLFSTRAGIEALNPKGNPRKLALWTTGLLFVGGFILGPLVQKFAFGYLWTGFPFGTDLTDNKTLIAMIGWIAALIAGRRGKPARWWVLGASILLMAIYLIPHSLLGSELDYSQLDASSSLPKEVSRLYSP
ncbi:MAG: hypothetical protein JSV46_06590 [Candidatus Aminicenantes bacterium]|nr:MAG: hypothetical protein JSV46_06590 [Candidatus Aminicenantes bacterium]